MAEKPILFGGDMVRAIIARRKTQTRRKFKLPAGFRWTDESEGWCACDNTIGDIFIGDLFCRYGSAGDSLWVRETFAVYGDEERHVLHYRADKIGGSGWKPSIHMPRWVSRIDLGIQETRVEKLQDISEEDAIAEGVEKIDTHNWRNYLDDSQVCFSAKSSFITLWSLINGRECWEANPWVDVVRFGVTRGPSYG